MPLTFAEALRFAESRWVELPSEYYGRLQGKTRDMAFSVAGVASRDQLQGVLDSLKAVQTQGLTFAQWKEKVKGGEIGLDLPEHRLDNIFRTNMQVAYNHGHWQQQQRFKSTRPYLMYDAVNDSRTRPSHLELDNVIRPIDDAFWASHYPPNGYRCRCSAISMTEAQARARGGVTEEPTEGWPKTDKGWDYNPGEAFDFGVEQAKLPRHGGSEQLQQAMEDMEKPLLDDLINVTQASRAVKDLQTVQQQLEATKQEVLESLREGTMPGATEPITVRAAEDFRGSLIKMGELTEDQQVALRTLSEEARAARPSMLEMPKNMGLHGSTGQAAANVLDDVFATLQMGEAAEAPTLYRIPPRGDVKVLGETVAINGKTYKVGQSVTQKGFMSAFAVEPAGVETAMFVIEKGASSAIPVSAISATPAELEWVFPADTKFLVKRIDGSTIFLEEQA